MKRNQHQQAIDENGANRKLREEIAYTDLQAIGLESRITGPRRPLAFVYPPERRGIAWWKIAAVLGTLAALGWAIVVAVGRAG